MDPKKYREMLALEILERFDKLFDQRREDEKYDIEVVDGDGGVVILR